MTDQVAKQRLGGSFTRLWGSAASSNLADGVLGVAVTLVTAQLTNSATAIAALRIARSVPDALAAMPAGALADRYDRRWIMVSVNLLRGAALGLIAGAAFLDLLSLPVLYVAVGLLGMAEVLVDTSAQSVLVGLVPRERLGTANARLYGTQVALTEFAGGPFGGLLVAAAAGFAFGVPAALYVFAALILLTLPGRYKVLREGPPTRMREDMREGLRVLLTSPLLRTMAIMTGLLNMANTAFFSVFVLFAVGEDSAMGLHEAAYGVLFATLAAGAVLGSAATELVERRLKRVQLLAIGIVGSAVSFAVPLFTTAMAPIAAAFFFSGLVVMLYRVAFTAVRQRLTPEPLLGRITASFRLVLLTSVPVGALLAGVLGDVAGLRVVFAMASLVSLATLVGFRVVTESAMDEAEEEVLRRAAEADGADD